MLTVRLVPLVETEPPLPLMVHWLLESDAALPTVIGPNQTLFASFKRRNVLSERVNQIPQALAPRVGDELTTK